MQLHHLLQPLLQSKAINWNYPELLFFLKPKLNLKEYFEVFE